MLSVLNFRNVGGLVDLVCRFPLAFVSQVRFFIADMLCAFELHIEHRLCLDTVARVYVFVF